MNKTIEELLKTESKLKNLSKEMKQVHLAGIGILGSIINDDFFDVPKLPKDRFDHNGVFYNIPYFDDEQLVLDSTINGKCVNVLTVYEVENRRSGCPLRIDFTLNSEKDFVMKLYFQLVSEPNSEILLESLDGKYYETLSPTDLSITKLMAMREKYGVLE